MFGIKKIFCRHQYVSVATFEEDLEVGVGYKKGEFHTIYCPKCRKTTDVLKHEYEKIIGIQEVDARHKNRNLDR